MRWSVLSKYRTELMGAAMLWVMLFHSWDMHFGVPLLDLFRSAGFGGVDMFIVLSSVGLVLSLNRREQPDSEFMARRARRILPAYYIVMPAFTVYLITQGRATLSALFWNASLLYYWVQPEGQFNWYVAGIMLFYAMTPALFRLLRRSRHREALTAAGIVLGVLLCRLLTMQYFGEYMDVFYRLPVLFLGLLVGFYVLEERKLTLRSVFFQCASVAAGLAYLKIRSVYQGFTLPMCHLFLFTTLPMCLLGCLCFEKLPLGGLRRFLRLVGENSLEIYLLNVSFFAEFDLWRPFFDPGPGHYLYFAVSYAVNIALGVLLHRGIEGLRQHLREKKGSL